METHFNKEFQQLLNRSNHQIVIQFRELLETQRINNYYNFLDNTLMEFGLLSFNYTHIRGNKYSPYLNFAKYNSFNEKSGICEISPELYSLKESQKLLAKRIIELIKSLKESDLHNINFNNN